MLIDNGVFLLLLIILAFNLNGKIILGDSGSYILGLFVGIYLINFSNQNIAVSPFFIILLLWYPCFELLFSMIETIEIAILGTFIAIMLSIPLALLSAKNIAPNIVIYLIARTITVFFRAIPEFIIAMILVIAIGFGAMPGVLALGIHTMGFLAKFYAEAIEHVNEEPIQALESMGASKWQVISFAIVPQIIPSFIGNNLYILDRNIRMATMLGIVGAGGIGYELQSAFRMFEYPRVSAFIIIIFVTIFLIDGNFCKFNGFKLADRNLLSKAFFFYFLSADKNSLSCLSVAFGL